MYAVLNIIGLKFEGNIMLKISCGPIVLVKSLLYIVRHLIRFAYYNVIQLLFRFVNSIYFYISL